MRWTHCSDDASVGTMAAEKAILCVVLFEEFSELGEIGVNMWLILQNTLNVTTTALAIQNKANIPIEGRDLWKLWFLIIVVQHLPQHFKMKKGTFQVKDNSLLTSKTVRIYMTVLFLLWVLGLLLLILI